MKRAILLVNLGTPESPSPKHVRKYLAQFLNDPFVIDMPWLIRKLLVNLIIIPFRVKKSTNLYKRLWTDKGSPILIYLEQLGAKMQKAVRDEAVVNIAMRYGKPSLRKTLKKINKIGVDELQVVPLFPQYASSTSESIIHEVQKNITKLQNVKNLRFTKQFYDHSGFISAFCERISLYHPESFDHIIFSFHSLPVRHIEKIHPTTSCDNCSCQDNLPSCGTMCYKATSYATARLIAEQLQINRGDYTVAFQSRFAKNWIGPFTEDIVVQSALSGKSRVLVVAPSFVADCLETIVEIGQDYQQLFKAHGGKELIMTESLNDSDSWVHALTEIVADTYRA